MASWDYHRCLNGCLDYQVTLLGIECPASNFSCICSKHDMIGQLLNQELISPCITYSCLPSAQSSIVNGVSSACASQNVFIGSIIDDTNPLSKFLLTPTPVTLISPATRLSATSTSATTSSTLLFVATTAFTSTAFSPLATRSSIPVEHTALSSQATGGIATGATVIGLAIIAGVAWLLRRRIQNVQTSAQNIVVTHDEHVVPQHLYHEDIKYAPQHHEETQELPADVPFMPANRLSELDSIRPVSELQSVESTRESWAAAAMSPTLPDVVEVGSGKASPPLKSAGDAAANADAIAERTSRDVAAAVPQRDTMLSR